MVYLSWIKCSTKDLDGDMGVPAQEAWAIRLDGEVVARVQRGPFWTYRAAVARKRGGRLNWRPGAPALRSWDEAARWVRQNLPKTILKAVSYQPEPVFVLTDAAAERLAAALARA